MTWFINPCFVYANHEVSIMTNVTSINYDSYYFKTPELQEFYLSLPQSVQNRLDHSGVEIATLGELKQAVSHMEHQ